MAFFPDHDVAYWRSSRRDDATAFAFKSGAPEGHAATESLKAFPDWRLSSGHAHPDAGDFIIWANGKYLTGDSGYAGIPLTEHHNTLVFDGSGQAKEGKGHDAFAGVPYERLNKIRILDAKFSAEKVLIIADVAPAYEPEVEVTKFIRRFEFTAPNDFLITDTVETAAPKIITSYLHADNSIEKNADGSFLFESPKPNLLVKILSPLAVETRVEKNILTAPGRPGSVDKGMREERGVRLAISSKEKVKQAKLQMELTIQNK